MERTVRFGLIPHGPRRKGRGRWTFLPFFLLLITKMDQMTQQNAALVEEAAAAGEAMAEQAQMMNQTVEFFSLSESSSTPILEQTYLPDERYLPSLA